MKNELGVSVPLLRRTFLLLALIITSAGVRGQKLNFGNYSVEQGLGQSQVQRLVQDEYGFLWAGTLGGISRFNGKEFKNFTKRDGLASQIIFAVEYQPGRGLWIGSQNGLQLFDGDTVRSIVFANGKRAGPVVDIVAAGPGRVFALGSDGKLLAGQREQLEPLKEFEDREFFQITKDRQGQVYGLSGAGLHALSGKTGLSVSGSHLGKDVTIHHVYFDPRNNACLITDQGIFRKAEGSYHRVSVPQGLEMTAIEEDPLGVLWVGTSSGAFRVDTKGNTTHINAAAGFTDNRINDILADREGNIWFASEADGLFKLSPNSLEYLDESHGLNGEVVMGMATDNMGTVWLGSLDGGLTRFSGGKATKITLPANKPEAQRINALHYDFKGRLWIGTIGNGLWVRENEQYRMIPEVNSHSAGQVITLYEDRSHTLWVGTSAGLYYLSGDSLHKIKGLNLPCFAILQDGNELILGTTAGLLRISEDKSVSQVALPGFAPGTVNCLTKEGSKILIGTEDDGILIWDRLHGTVRQCSGRDGLTSDFIFSLYSVGAGHFFAGTGRGINEITGGGPGEKLRVRSFAKAHNLYGPECNLNAILPRENGELWFGTTRGVYIYRNLEREGTSEPPTIYLNSVGIYRGGRKGSEVRDSLVAWSMVPGKLSLSPRNNHISFEFDGLYLSDPDGLRYRYQLIGADDSLSAPSRSNRVIYPNLSPGNYRFRAIAISPEGISSSNEIDYSFTVESPFYQTPWFRLLIISLLILIGFLFEYLRGWMRRRRLQLNEQIRREEQKTILERTSEDLHDDLGNKITRITVLADVLQRKIAPGDTDKTHLINQIRENAQALYHSTKDILWTLTPGQDTLLDILEKCQSMGAQLFSDAEMDFEAHGIQPQMNQIKVPFSIARNLNLIVKEAFTNILRHSGAEKVVMQVALHPERRLEIQIHDNGRGMVSGTRSEGKGLVNMQKRMGRIGGSLDYGNDSSGGFTVSVEIKIPLTEG